MSDPVRAEHDIPPGWYRHPTMAATRGYWDGERWTDHVAPAVAPPVPPRPASVGREEAKARKSDTLVLIGWLGMFLMPLLAFIVGIVVLSRRPVAGSVLIVVSVLLTVLYVSSLPGY